jgi:hypothetical protein
MLHSLTINVYAMKVIITFKINFARLNAKLDFGRKTATASIK